MKQKIYIDYNATAPIRDSVIEIVASAMTTVGNPSSVHSAGRTARGLVEQARIKIAALAGARARDITFCSGGTEANNTVILGSGCASLIISKVEHDCGLAAADTFDKPRFDLAVTQDGIVDLEELRRLLADAPKPALISVMMANNETGVLQPIDKIIQIAQEFDARVHTDAVQAAGKIPLDMAGLGADYLTLSSHKIGGPQGVGAIVTAPTAPLKPLIKGGGQELGRRSGTENVAGVAGFGAAAIEAMDEIADADRQRALRDQFESAVRSHANEVVIVGADSPRLANTSCVAMPGVKGETQVMHFDLKSICLSSGSACSSGKVKVSHVLTAMGYEPSVAESSIRVSIGRSTTERDVDVLINAWRELYDRTAARAKR
jgi:cysteine desulfurase